MQKNTSKNQNITGKPATVVVGLSGGVDSSVVAFLLKKQGYKLVGLHMKTENETTSKDDEQTVRTLCEKLGIELHVVDYKNEMQVVKDYFIKEYLSGRTPNPCVVCNREVKFVPFVEYAKKIGADYFATGHYAKIEHKNGEHILKTAVDTIKDQTYFLCNLSEIQLSKALFPLGEYTKAEVKEIAIKNGLASETQKESQDICFLGSEKFKDFMSKNYAEKQGDIIDAVSGAVVGKHTGISKYTIGQRKGLGIGGGHGITGECWFVVKKDIKQNILFVAQGNDDVLYSSGLVASKFNWLQTPKENTFECFAKFRYRQGYQKVNVKIENEKTIVTFADRQKSITLGQYVVLYLPSGNGYICLGGGTIDDIIK